MSGAQNKNNDVIYVPAGWEVPAPGYWVSEQAGRDILAGWRTDRSEKAVWMKAYEDLTSEYQAYRDEMSSLSLILKEQVETERNAWEKSLKRARGPGFGFFAGYGSGGITFGGGIVWKVF